MQKHSRVWCQAACGRSTSPAFAPPLPPSTLQGPKHSIILSVCQNLNMFLTTIGYQIAAADSMKCAPPLLSLSCCS